jgi:hypothetical protein
MAAEDQRRSSPDGMMYAETIGTGISEMEESYLIAEVQHDRPSQLGRLNRFSLPNIFTPPPRDGDFQYLCFA